MTDFSSEIISHIDRGFVADLLSKGERVDGRAFGEYREIIIEPNPVAAKAEGSAIVRLGDTSVVAGVKVLTGPPYPDTPDEGVIMIAAEMAPMASPLFELGPPKEPAIELARIVDRGVRESKTMDAKALCIKPGKLVYMVFADVYTLEYDGNLIDASSIAVNAALLGTKFPEIKLEDGEEVATGKELTLPLQNMAIEHTVAKIGNHLVIDPVLKEAMVMDCRLTMAVDKNDNFTAMQKGGGAGPISLEMVDQAMGMALDSSKEIRELITSTMKNPE
ncbi:MAG: exosome complex protein Rrp42 [Candidatus Thorarchaeota archaeon SMTZ1-83]